MTNDHSWILYSELLQYKIALYENNIAIQLTLAYKPHSPISHTPSLATQILGKNFWKEIKRNQKWSLENYVFHVYALFLTCVNPPINSLAFKTENTKTLTYNFSAVVVWKSDFDINLYLSLAFLIQYFIPVHFSIEFTYKNKHLMNVSVCL